MLPCRRRLAFALLCGAGLLHASAQKPFTLRQVLSAPYATDLTSSPAGAEFAWVENAEGRHNLWVGGTRISATQLTHYREDDAQDITGVAWSSDGQYLAFARGAENGANGRPANPAHLQPEPIVQVMLVRPDGSAPPVSIAQGRAPLFAKDGSAVFFLHSGSIWVRQLGQDARSTPCVGESHALAEVKATDANAKQRDGNCGEQLVFERGTDSQLTLSPDGTQLAFVSRRDHDHSFIGLFDLKARTLQFIAPSTGSDFAPAFSRDGKSLAWLRVPYTEAPEFAAKQVSSTPWSVQVADLSTGEAHTAYAPEWNSMGSVLPHTATGEPKVWWTADGRILFYSEVEGWIHLYAVDPSTRAAPMLLTPGAYEVEDTTLSADGRTLAYASNQLPTDDPKYALRLGVGGADFTDNDRRHLWEVDLTASQPQPKRVTAGTGIEARPQFAANSSLLAALVSDARHPMHAAIVSLAGQIASIHDDVPSDYPADKLRTPVPAIFNSTDKQYELHGQLFLPEGSTPATRDGRENGSPVAKHPAILFFHGGPNRQMLLGYPSMEYYSNAYAMNQYLASRGFIVLSVNYRCGIGYGMNFRECLHSGADGASEYNDLLGAAAYLRKRPDVDVQHIGVWGGSYGGYFTALALARNSDIFAAGVDFHGVHDWNKEDNAPDWLRGSYAEKDEIAARALASSPMADVYRWGSPVLLIHGDNDANVAYKQTPLLADALRANQVHVEELIFPDEVHEFLLHRDWLKSYEAEAEFFERTLMPGVKAASETHSR